MTAAGNPWANFSGQCVGWVRTVLPWVPGGPANAYQYASQGTLTSVGARQVPGSQAQVGDVVVWPAGAGGSDSSSGHIAVVSGLSSNGVQVSQANWDERGDPSTMIVPFSTLDSLDVYAPPANQQASSAQRAALSATGLPSAGTLGTSSGGQPAMLASDTTSSAQPYNQKLWYGTAFIPDGPYIHTIWKVAFTAGSLLLIWMGFRLLKGETPIALPKGLHV